MEDPVAELPGIIHNLTQGPPYLQEKTLEEYFTPDAVFVHPFCRVGRSPYSRLLILAIYRWYKVLSPTIELEINSVAFDRENLIVYLYMHQTFSLALVPFHHAHVALTTVLRLTSDKPPMSSDPSSPYSESSQPTKESQSLLHGQPTIYRITSQEDFYQPSELVEFLPSFGIGRLLVLLWQYWNTFLCVLGALAGYPFTAYLERRDQKQPRGD